MRFFRNIIAVLGLAVLLHGQWLIPSVSAQGIECDCLQYEERVNELSTEYDRMVEQMLVTPDAGSFMEYLPMLLELSTELQQALTNLDGCHDRLQTDIDICKQTALNAEDREILGDPLGRVSFSDAQTYEQLKIRIKSDLDVHLEEIGIDRGKSYRENLQLVSEFATESYGFNERSSSTLEQVLLDAINAFLSDLGIFPLDEKDCPDCNEIRADLEQAKQDLAGAEQDLQNAQQIQKSAENALNQFNIDLRNAINGLGAAKCEVVADYKTVNLQNGQAAGVMMGTHFYCKSEQSIKDFLDAIKAFRQNHRKYSELLKEIADAKAKVADLEQEVSLLKDEVGDLEDELAECLKIRQELECDKEEEVPLPALPPGQEYANLQPEDASAIAYFGYEDELVSFSRSMEQAYPAAERIAFSDLNKEDDVRFRAAVEELGKRRLLLGSGGANLREDQQRPSGIDEPLLRADLAQFLYRGGKVLQGYRAVTNANARVFADVDPSAWFGEPYAWMSENGFYKQGRPADTVNIAEAVTAVRRWLRLPEPTLRTGQVWYDPEFDALIKAGILDSRTRYGVAYAPATRGFVAFMINNAIQQGQGLIGQIGEKTTPFTKTLAEITRTDLDVTKPEQVVRIKITGLNSENSATTPKYHSTQIKPGTGAIPGVTLRLPSGAQNFVSDASKRSDGTEELELDVVISTQNYISGGTITFVLSDLSNSSNTAEVTLQIGPRQ